MELFRRLVPLLADSSTYNTRFPGTTVHPRAALTLLGEETKNTVVVVQLVFIPLD